MQQLPKNRKRSRPSLAGIVVVVSMLALMLWGYVGCDLIATQCWNH